MTILVTGFEQNMAGFMPKCMAYGMRLMAERYVSDGLVPRRATSRA